MRAYSSRAKVRDVSQYARKFIKRDRMIHEKHRPEGKISEGKGKTPRLADVWPET